MNIELRERALHAELSETEQKVVVQNTCAAVDIFLVYVDDETENDGTVSKLLHAEVLRGLLHDIGSGNSLQGSLWPGTCRGRC